MKIHLHVQACRTGQQPDSKLPKNNWEYVIVCLEVNKIIRSCRLSDKMVSKFPRAKRRVSSSYMPSASVVPQL